MTEIDIKNKLGEVSSQVQCARANEYMLFLELCKYYAQKGIDQIDTTSDFSPMSFYRNDDNLFYACKITSVIVSETASDIYFIICVPDLGMTTTIPSTQLYFPNYIDICYSMLE